MFKKKRSYLIPSIGFLLIILIGAALLMLPISNKKPILFKDAMFMSVSGLTTNGMGSVNIQEQFTFFGQFVLLVLMEIGALGFVVFISYFWALKNKKVTMSDMIVIRDNISGDSYSQLKQHSAFVIDFMLKVQATGMILLAFQFIPDFGFARGIWYSIFHMVSAFSNTGFHLLDNNGLCLYGDNLYVQLVIMTFMLIGSIGVLVIEDLNNLRLKKQKKLRVQSKLVLIYTAIMIFLPLILIHRVEGYNSTIMNSLFMVVSSRSTGFSVVNLAAYTNVSKVVLIVLMFIGGGPISTSGGVRIVPFAIVIATIYGTLKGKKDTIIFWKKIPDSAVRKSFTVVMLFILLICVSTMIIMHDTKLTSMDVVFNVTSALGTTGFQTVDINDFTIGQQYLLMLLSFIGRVGPLSWALIFINENNRQKSLIYPKEDVVI